MKARQLWKQWLSEADRQTAICVYESQIALLEAWLSTIAHQYDLPSLALEKVATLVNQPTEQLFAWLNNTSEYEVRLFWQRLATLSATAPMLQWLLDQPSLSETRSRQPITVLPSWLASGDLLAIVQVLIGVMQLLPPHLAPGILVLTDEEDGLPAASQILMTLTQLVEALPSLPVGLGLTTAQGERLLKQLPESRVKAMLRSGLITVTSPNPNHLKQWFSDRGVVDEVRLQTILSWAEDYGATPEFLETALALSTPAEPPNTAAADAVYRSQAERFLFQCLEARPKTVGKFQLNARLNICFGNRPMEVDFLATEARLVIELDGYYHFGSPEDYRRDRRKDFLLQQEGFLILRFLAEDVVAQLETILATVDQAIALRQSQLLNRSEA